MDETKINMLYEHYKCNVETLKAAANKRDLMFLMLILSIMLIAIQSVNAEFINGLLVSVGKLDDKRLPGNALLLVTFALASFVLFIRYTQACFFIDMQYKYLHTIEAELNSLFPDTQLFTFEGLFYKNSNSFYRKAVSFFYKRAFSVILIFFLVVKMMYELDGKTHFDIYFYLNGVVFITYLIYVFIYLFKR